LKKKGRNRRGKRRRMRKGEERGEEKGKRQVKRLWQQSLLRVPKSKVK
jgi:hypothetical protein